MYSVSVVLKRIWKRKAGNIITAVQIFIGITLILFSLNILMYTKTRNNELLESAKNKIYTISVRNIPKTPRSHIISEEQLNRLHDIPDLKTTALIKYNIITFAGESHLENGENITDKYVVSFSEEADRIYSEKEFADVLPNITAENTVNFSDIDFNYIKDYSIFDDKNVYTHSCIMPLNMYWEAAQPSSFAEFDFSVVCEDSSEIKKIFELEEILSESEEYEFYVSNDFYDFLGKASYAKSSSSRIILFSAIVLIVVFISTVCIFLLLIDERAFEIAVCRMSGAGSKTVFLEFAFELLFISLIPTLLSILTVGFIFKDGFYFIGITIPSIYIAPIFFAVFGIFLADIICLIPVAFKIYRFKPYELLVSEG